MDRIFDLLFEKLICEAFEHKIVYTRRLDNRNQRNVRKSEFVRVETYYTDYARMKRFTAACRNFNEVGQALLESASRRIFVRNVLNLENNVFDGFHVF